MNSYTIVWNRIRFVKVLACSADLVPHTNNMIVYDMPDRKALADQIPRTLG